MKKLLILLSSLCLSISASSYEIACKAKKTGENIDDENAEENTYETLLNDYKSVVNDIVAKKLSESSINWYAKEESTYNNKFLNLDKIKNYIPKDSQANSNVLLSDIFKNNEAKNYYYEDVKPYIGFDSIKYSLNLLKSTGKYDLLIKNISEDQLVTINMEKTDETDVSDFKAFLKHDSDFNNVDVHSKIYLQFNYLDKSGTKIENFENKFSFDYSITKNINLYDAINKSLKTLKYDLLAETDANTSSIIESSIEDKDKIINDFANIEKTFNEKFNNDNLKNKILNTFKNNAQTDVNTSFVFDDKNESIINNFGKDIKEIWNYALDKNVDETKYAWKTERDVNAWKDESILSNQDLYDYILKDVSAKKDENGYEIALKNHFINNFKDMYSKYYNLIKDDFNVDKVFSEGREGNKSAEDILKAIQSTINIKLLDITGLKVKIGDYENDIANLKIYSGFSVNKNENILELTTNNEALEKATIFNAVLTNVEKGIKSFKDIYGIGTPTKIDKDGYEDYRLFAFDGGKYDIWNTFENTKLANMNWVFYIYSPFYNSILSLKENIANQVLARNDLLTSGNQKNFEIGFDLNRDSSKPLGFSLKQSLSNDPFNQLWNQDTPGIIFNQTGGSASGNTLYMDFIYKLDFLNLSFRTDKVYGSYTVENVLLHKSYIEKIVKKEN
ncbi:hypothetical protein [Spiroplasma tabanidicola]|uniref:Lipoprotein n=1 Tax=Spiroplasma tabanidicola TaxID=324079 RepID=A0A6I6C7M4_9MOLU|nr:hypothetical protein [Spiroplasma tabanidicola]QGS52220.1 hypothetical protein STABA_v1c08650 [Spiroplasma tabanidicola]